jgi:hypothetical protein
MNKRVDGSIFTYGEERKWGIVKSAAPKGRLVS